MPSFAFFTYIVRYFHLISYKSNSIFSMILHCFIRLSSYNLPNPHWSTLTVSSFSLLQTILQWKPIWRKIWSPYTLTHIFTHAHINIYFFKYIQENSYLFIAMSCSLQEFSSPTMDWSPGHSSGSTEY